MTPKVLVIEDDEANRRILEMALRGLGCEVTLALNGEEGLAKARAIQPDLVLMDVMMPKMSGLDTLQKIRQEATLAKVPVVVVSAKAADQDRANAIKAGANEFVTKPFRVKTIQDVVEKYITRA